MPKAIKGKSFPMWSNKNRKNTNLVPMSERPAVIAEAERLSKAMAHARNLSSVVRMAMNVVCRLCLEGGYPINESAPNLHAYLYTHLPFVHGISRTCLDCPDVFFHLSDVSAHIKTCHPNVGFKAQMERIERRKREEAAKIMRSGDNRTYYSLVDTDQLQPCTEEGVFLPVAPLLVMYVGKTYTPETEQPSPSTAETSASSSASPEATQELATLQQTSSAPADQWVPSPVLQNYDAGRQFYPPVAGPSMPSASGFAHESTTSPFNSFQQTWSAPVDQWAPSPVLQNYDASGQFYSPAANPPMAPSYNQPVAPSSFFAFPPPIEGSSGNVANYSPEDYYSYSDTNHFFDNFDFTSFFKTLEEFKFQLPCSFNDFVSNNANVGLPFAPVPDFTNTFEASQSYYQPMMAATHAPLAEGPVDWNVPPPVALPEGYDNLAVEAQPVYQPSQFSVPPPVYQSPQFSATTPDYQTPQFTASPQLSMHSGSYLESDASTPSPVTPYQNAASVDEFGWNQTGYIPVYEQSYNGYSDGHYATSSQNMM